MSRDRYQSTIELMAYDDGYQQGRADAIDEFIEEIMKRPLVNYFQILELIKLAKQIKEQTNENS